MIIGAQLFSVRDKCTTQEEIDSTFKAIKEMGYPSVQVSGFPYDPTKTRESAEKYGLHIGLTHTNIKDVIEKTDEVIENHKLLGVDYIGVGYPNGYTDGTNVEVDRMIADLAPAVKKINDAGLKFGYHNHAMEFTADENGKRPIDVIIEKTNWNIILDTGWAHVAGANVCEYIEKIADRLEYVHLKDFREKKDEEALRDTIVPIYSGIVPFDEIIPALEKAGTKVAYVEQDNAPTFGDSIGEMKKSYDAINKKGFIK